VTRGRALLFTLLGASYALAGVSLVFGPPPIWLPASLMLALLVVVALGVGFLNLGVFLRVVSRVPTREPRVAFTFDDGPHPVHTRQVMDLLERAGARGTFFVIGEKVARLPEVVSELVRRGHEVGLHSQRHDRLQNLRAEEAIVLDLEENRAAVEAAAGVRPTLFRPPVGLSSPRTCVAVDRLGLEVVGWSARAYDGAASPEVDTVVRRILPHLEPGAIVLLHDARERGDEAPSSLAALERLLELSNQRGLRGVTLTQLRR
jgi:peptidoglycan/xylan/chitin deacetylase (PgdA/CDA1 family)